MVIGADSAGENCNASYLSNLSSNSALYVPSALFLLEYEYEYIYIYIYTIEYSPDELEEKHIFQILRWFTKLIAKKGEEAEEDGTPWKSSCSGQFFREEIHMVQSYISTSRVLDVSRKEIDEFISI